MAEPHTDPDRDLVLQAAAGDREAFDELVRRHHARVVNLVRAMTGGDEDAEDVAQEIFVRAYRGIRRFRGDSAFRTWLYTIVLNTVRSHAGRRSRWRAFWASPADEGPDLESVPDPADSGPEADLVRRDAIDHALASLPPELKSAVILRDIEGLEYSEIAALLGVPIGTVESRIFRARRRLRPLLEPLLGGSRSGARAGRVQAPLPARET